MKSYVRDHRNNRTHVRPSDTALQAPIFNVDEKLSRMLRALQSAPSRPKKAPTATQEPSRSHKPSRSRKSPTVRKFSWEA